MSNPRLPNPGQPIVQDNGLGTRPWIDYFRSLDQSETVEALRLLVDQAQEAINELERSGGLSKDTRVFGDLSIDSQGTLSQGVVVLTLVNDQAIPNPTTAYGANPEGFKGFYPVSDALASIEGETTKEVAENGVTSLGLADVPDEGGGSIRKFNRDSKGRVSGTSDATTDDLPEGSDNLYFTDERAQDAAGAIVGGTGDVELAYESSPARRIWARLSASVLSALDSARSALQAGDNVSELTNDAGYVDAAGAADAAPIQSIVAGSNITIDDSDPANPVISGEPGGGDVESVNGQTGVVVLTATDVGAATQAQGDLADSAVQPSDLSAVATSGQYNDLAGRPTLGTAAAANTTDFDPAGAAASALASANSYTDSGLSQKVDITDVRLTNAREWTALTVPQAEAEAGTSTTRRAWTAQRVHQAVRAALLTGLSTSVSAIVTATDSVLTAIGKLQAQISLKADDNAVVHRTGNESVSGNKTWSGTSTHIGDLISQHTTGVGLVVDRTNNNVNSVVEFKTTAGSLYAGQRSPTLFAIGPNSNLNNAPWVNIGSDRVAPQLDNVLNLGLSVARWTTVYAATGSISTSDEREKHDVRVLTSEEVRWAVALSREIKLYQWKEAVARKGVSGARWHAGMTVQRAMELGRAEGLDPTRYAFICYDAWPETPEQWEDIPARRDEQGNILEPARRELVQEYRPAGNRYSFRMDQLNDFIARGLAQRVSSLETRFARSLQSNASGVALVELPAAGMVLSVTPRNADVVLAGIVNETVNGKPHVRISFKRLRSNTISLLGLVSLSLFEQNPGVVSFDLVAVQPT